MFNLQGSEIIFILLLALVVLGPEKLPGAIRRFTRTYAELRKMGTSFQDEVRSAFEEPVREVRETADLIRHQVDVEALEAEQESANASASTAADAEAETGDGGVEPGSGASIDDTTDQADECETGPDPSAIVRSTVPAPPPPFSPSHTPDAHESTDESTDSAASTRDDEADDEADEPDALDEADRPDGESTSS